MDIKAALKLVRDSIDTGEVHAHYNHVTKLAEDYKIFITGKKIGKKLIQFVQREDAALFAQRLLLTKSTTPAVASSLRTPFNKVSRNDRIRKEIKVKGEKAKQVVDKMVKAFYGAERKKNRGLDYWLKTRFIELTFSDPNAWVVVEWDAPESESQVVNARPFEVPSANAINYFVANDVVKWLLVRQPITYLTYEGSGTAVDGSKTAKKVQGFRFTLYDEEVTVVYEQVCKDWIKTNYQFLPGEETIEINDKTYIVRTYTPGVGYAPVFRIGYKRDEETDGQTFVNPWHDALCYFEKSLKTVSELDLTMCLHTFPQKLQYVHKCTGPDLKTKCHNGMIQGTENTTCPACKGTGYKMHTTAQDAILLPMPDTATDMIDLEKILVYKAPPIDLIKFQNDYVQQLERQTHQAVYNSQVFVRKQFGGIDTTPTATENDNNMQSVYDTLEPFTEKTSEIWRDLVTTFAIIAGEKLDDIEVVHDFPADYKLKTSDILLGERKQATDSGAPSFLIETIDDDLAGIIYTADPLGMQKYRVKRRYFPFTGNTPDEIAALLSSQYVPEEPKILYSNFDMIFKEIEMQNPEFWTMIDKGAQADLVKNKVVEYSQRLKEQKPALTIDSFRGFGGGGSEGGEGGGENPGENNNKNNSNETVTEEGQQQGTGGN